MKNIRLTQDAMRVPAKANNKAERKKADKMKAQQAVALQKAIWELEEKLVKKFDDWTKRFLKERLQQAMSVVDEKS